MLETMDKKCKNFLGRMESWYGVFLSWLGDRLESVCDYIYRYPSLSTCVFSGLLFILVLSCILN